VRTLARLDVEGRAGAEIQIRIEGDGFLRQMVRVLAGTLVEVGRGRRRPESMAAILAARDRRRAGATAPAHGLTLVRVFYASPGPVASDEAVSNPFSDAIPRS
jgi:tRNA pseudouridine38-40 synthase